MGEILDYALGLKKEKRARDFALANKIIQENGLNAGEAQQIYDSLDQGHGLPVNVATGEKESVQPEGPPTAEGSYPLAEMRDKTLGVGSLPVEGGISLVNPLTKEVHRLPGVTRADKVMIENPTLGNKVYTPDQMTAIQSGDPSQLSSAFPGGVPEDAYNHSIQHHLMRQSQDQTVGLRQDQHQDRLEQQAKQSISNLRGDKSLARSEEQRDAAISAYNLIQQVKDEGRLPSKLEYYDLLGQMWRARTGQAPSDQAIRDLDARTFKGDLSKAATYITGNPTGATTAAVLDNIQKFAQSSGEQADQFHEGYMRSHLIRPKGLADDRWQPIFTTGRGMSFSEGTKGHGGASVQSGAGIPIVNSQAEYEAMPSGTVYMDSNGKRAKKK